jgi:hypothetical protein
MKILIHGNVKLQYSWFVLTFQQGFRLLGHDVYGIDFRSTPLDDAKKQILSINPDIIFTHLSFHPIYPSDKILQFYKDIKNHINTTVIHVLADARHEPRYNKSIKGSFDMALVSQTENLEKFKNYWKVPTFFCPYSSLTYEKMGNFDSSLAFNDAVFTGSPNTHPDRSEFIKKLNKIMKIKVFKTQSKDDLRHKTLDLSASAKCILGLCTGYDIKHYIDVRPFQYLGAGACMIIRKFKNMDDIIPNDIYYPFDSYNDPYVVKNIFDNIGDASKIKQKAFNYMQQNHSSVVRMKEILNYIKEL